MKIVGRLKVNLTCRRKSTKQYIHSTPARLLKTTNSMRGDFKFKSRSSDTYHHYIKQ